MNLKDLFGKLTGYSLGLPGDPGEDPTPSYPGGGLPGDPGEDPAPSYPGGADPPSGAAGGREPV